ncbi:MAG: hypothetical protein J7L23_03565 [Candidatus Diapherotrites archaeon]|nr:hypothetical protein [Candidatus Diapherotrites archaeon]
MLRGQLSVGFVARTAVGFILIVGLSYAVLNMADSMKKGEQEKTITITARYIGGQILGTMENIQPNQTVKKTIRLPVFRESTTQPYAVTIESVNGGLFVTVKATQWKITTRYPLYLNSTEVEVNSRISYPPKLCLTISRDTKYHINVTC